MKSKNNKIYFDWLLEEGAINYEYGHNVIFAERAFVANSILRWCARKAKQKTMNEEHMRQYLKMLRFFIKKKIDLYWENGTINTNLEHSPRGEKDASDSMEL